MKNVFEFYPNQVQHHQTYTISVTLCCFIAFLVCGILSSSPVQAQTKQVFVTWKGIEPDKCASAWLLRRFVDPEANFRIIPRDAQPPENGVLFDTPTATFKTSHRSSTFASICKHYHFDDPGILRIRRIIQDIELNKWEQKTSKVSPGLITLINGLRIKEGETRAALESSLLLFDWLYASFSSGGSF